MRRSLVALAVIMMAAVSVGAQQQQPSPTQVAIQLSETLASAGGMAVQVRQLVTAIEIDRQRLGAEIAKLRGAIIDICEADVEADSVSAACDLVQYKPAE